MLRQLATTAMAVIAMSTFVANPAKSGNTATRPATVDYVSKIDSSDLLATRLIGLPVYSGAPNGTPTTGAKADGTKANPSDLMTPSADTHIGDINNLIVTRDGAIDGVVIGVGDFLRIGEKNVAVAFDDLHWSADGTGKPVAYLSVTKEQLQNAPSFDVSMLQMKANGQNPQATGSAGQDVAVDGPADSPVVDATKISASDLMRTAVYDAANQNVGSVADVIVTKSGKIDAIVVDVGGFLGIGQKPVAIAFDDLNIRKDRNGTLTAYTAFTKQQLDNAPQYDKDKYQNQRDTMRLHTRG